MMDIEAFLLCDAATDQGGKLNVLGAFDTVFSGQVPATHPACAVALRIRFTRIEEGRHPFRICVIDEDGSEVFPRLEGNISVRVPPQADSSIVNVIANLQRLTLPRYGKYRIDLAIDSQHKASLPFTLTEIPPRKQ
ncbi:MAG: hypothetical protein ABSE89_11780 [Sedimentisphaerales bacterium]